jgi:hypothetical protein
MLGAPTGKNNGGAMIAAITAAGTKRRVCCSQPASSRRASRASGAQRRKRWNQCLSARQACVAGCGAADEAEGEDAHAHRNEGAQAIDELCAFVWDLRHGVLLRIE